MIHSVLIGKRIVFIFFTVLCCLLMGNFTLASATDYVVVVNKSLNIDNISSSDLSAIFTGKKKFWDSGEKVTIAIFADEEVQQEFLSEHVRKTPSQYKNFWKKMVFTGKANMPDYINTLDEVVAFVNATPGAIAFIPAPGGVSVKVLKIQ